MTFSNNGAKGMSFAPVTPMIPIPGPNTAPNSQGIPNHPNYFLVSGTKQTVSTRRTSTIDAGSVLGAASGTNGAQMDPMQGSNKVNVQGSPVTRLGDQSMTNNHNASTVQCDPSQTKCAVNA
ncbi:MAG: PAAR-like domain-containing protein [Chania sp.]